MDITILILDQMIQFFLMLLMGVFIVKSGILKSEDSRILSEISVYIVMPCVIISAFQIDYTVQIIQKLALAFIAAVAIHVAFFALTVLLGRSGKLSEIEKASLIYSNAGNMIIPIVMSVLGEEWVLYSSAYVSVQIVFLWTHCKGLICQEKKIEWKKIVFNINILAIAVGVSLFFLKIRLPLVVTGMLKSVGSLMAPMGMLGIGMIAAGSSLRKIFGNPRIYLIALFRLLLYPAVVAGILFISGAVKTMPDANVILFIAFLASMTPVSATITQMAQVYGKDFEYAGSINIVTTVFCLLTMPIMTSLFWMIN